MLLLDVPIEESFSVLKVCAWIGTSLLALIAFLIKYIANKKEEADKQRHQDIINLIENMDERYEKRFVRLEEESKGNTHSIITINTYLGLKQGKSLKDILNEKD